MSSLITMKLTGDCHYRQVSYDFIRDMMDKEIIREYRTEMPLHDFAAVVVHQADVGKLIKEYEMRYIGNTPGNNSKFWMVFVEGGNSPAVRHATKAIAQAEAERLAAHTGRVAFVLEATDKYQKPTIVHEVL